ncbi:tripartite tricarboxylate transporter substrate binding protein [Ramlibacter sp. AN1015]|uniref:Bug family tripartite tricarboxylate transporter substrate binding protein n=1 Tax=Ramlibacter sp. AN1015 TaxID=3133428 RepID=UPI0030BAFA18
MIPTFRKLARPLAAALAFTAVAAVAPAGAQAPDKPLRMVVPYPAGGTADVLPRLLAEKMREAYPAGVLVENRTGAGGNIGAEYVARADADGTTLLASPPGPIAINQHLYKKLSFDPAKWEPVTVMATVPNVLAVSSKVPANTVEEFIAYLKANPDKVSYASQGNGSTSHLTANLFMQLTGTKMTHIPYRGTAPALADLVGGQVDVFFDNIASSAQFHQSGRIKILAVADDRRSDVLPQVPTFAEQKLPAMQSVTFFSVVAPPGTPQSAITYASKALTGALAQPDVKQKFAAQGAEVRGWAPQRSGEFIRSESEKWKKVIQSANVTVD